ncbi:MAG: acyl carrier protein [Candidatus Omnitrophica bacterium]|nr:acyl carrier protein [Candidatus Omnitrophota bacterium]MBU1923926.1 acyl carrier protein [Candidatus Omnitrophota bacterium]
MKNKVREFIIKHFLIKEKELGDNQMLFKEGIIDSFGFVVLLVFLEKEFNIRFNRSEISIENFDTVNHITESVSKKIAQA